MLRVSDLIPGFADELEKLASLGALAGGAAGFAMGGDALKSKLLNTAAGAGVGQLAGRALGNMKRSIYDDPKAREQAALYGYQPSAVMNGDPNQL